MRKYSLLKQIPTLLLCAALAAGCTGNTFKVKGTIAGAKNGTLYLQREEDGGYVNVDSLDMGPKGRFEFSGDAADPQMYYLAFGKAAPVISFFAEPGEITVEARIDSLEAAKVTGGPEQALYADFQRYMKDFAQRRNKAYLDILRSSAVDGDKDSVEVYTRLYETIGIRQVQFVANFVVTHPESLLSPLLASTFLNQGYSPLLDTIAAKFPPRVAGSRYGKEFVEYVSAAKSTLVGMKAPDFEIKGDTVSYSLKQFGGKYLFVTVWASGGGESRNYMSALKDVYEKWHGQGLEVLSSCVSRDDEAYRDDMNALYLPWIEVRDARGVKNTLVEKFALSGALPVGILIGPDGTILARNVSPQGLDRAMDYLTSGAAK